MMQVYDVFHDKQAETDFVGACVFFLGFRLIEAHPDAALFLSRDGVSLIIYRTVDAVLILAERKGDLTSGLFQILPYFGSDAGAGNYNCSDR